MTAAPRKAVASRAARTLALLAEARSHAHAGRQAEARDLCWRVVRLNEPLARKYAAKHMGALDFDDALQASRIGLFRAAMKFDPARGASYSHWSAWWARAEVLDLDCVDRELSNHDAELLRRLRIVERQTADEAETAARIGVSPRSLARLRLATRCRLSLEAPVHQGDRDALRLGDTLAAPARDEDARIDGNRVVRLVASLPDRQATVLLRMFGIGTDEPATAVELVREVGVNRNLITAAKQRGIAMVRQKLARARIAIADGWAWEPAPKGEACEHSDCSAAARLTWEGPSGSTHRCNAHPPAEAAHAAPPGSKR